MVVCVPMWEYLHPGQEWLDDVDLMLAPTQFTFELLSQWITRFGFSWKLEKMPWPVDTHRFRFRPRHECRRFVFVNGRGGRSAIGWDGAVVQLHRKGLGVLLAAAKLVPEIPIVIYSCERPDAVPINVELRPPPGDNSLLYCDGDVCVQPSHWEGLGLPLLECQSSGMPLITTGAPPMSEHRPLALIPANVKPMLLRPQQCIFGARIEPQYLASTLRAVHGRDIRRASRAARHFIEREHSWPVARPRILEAIASVVTTAGRRITR
jgi:glycosyltransferase involved in cell wall biosynthesis